MPLSPEIRTIPDTIKKFNRAGLTGELITALLTGQNGRDMIPDAKRLLVQYGEGLVKSEGTEKIPIAGGALLMFNHPNMDVLTPAMLKIMVDIHDHGGHTPVLMQGAEIPLFASFNESVPLPGSIALLRRFHALYPETFISVPMSRRRKDYDSGRFLALRHAMRSLKNGGMVFISPEGHVEKDNTISPTDTFHDGAGRLAILASDNGIPSLPVGIWRETEEGQIRVSIGDPFFFTSHDPTEAVSGVMHHIADILPEHLRGPFADTSFQT